MGIEDPFSDVNPAWEFMKDPELRRLTILLDESFSSLKKPAERAVARANFKEGVERMMQNIKTTPANRLPLIIHFIRKNLSSLDAGGVSNRRSEQDAVLAEANEYFIENHKKLWDEMTTKIWG